MIPRSLAPRLATFLLLAPVSIVSQDFSDYHIERVAGGYRFANSPLWVREGFLLFTDAPSNRVLRWVPGAKPDTFLEDAGGPSGLGMDTQARLYICQGRGRRVVRVEKDKRLQPVAENWQGKKFNAPNDIVVRRDGHAWFTDPAFGYQQDSRELDFYGVYHIAPKGEVSPIAKWTTRPNGIGMNFAGRILYVADSDRRSIRAFDIDRGGTAANERSFVAGVEGVPRGLTLDEKGNVYVAAKSVDVYSPAGRRVARFEFAAAPSACSFGDGDLQGLYVTAGDSLYRIRLNVKGAVQH